VGVHVSMVQGNDTSHVALMCGASSPHMHFHNIVCQKLKFRSQHPLQSNAIAGEEDVQTDSRKLCSSSSHH
jgi:hypothetical protein